MSKLKGKKKIFSKNSSKYKNKGKLYIPKNEKMDFAGAEDLSSAIHVEKPTRVKKKAKSAPSSSSCNSNDVDDNVGVIDSGAGVAKGTRIDVADEFNNSLVSLEETDPEFHKFLQQNDPSLLNFDRIDGEEFDEAMEEEDDDGDSDGDEDKGDDSDSDSDLEDFKPNGHDKIERATRIVEVTESLVRGLVAKASTGSLVSIKNLLTIFRYACIPKLDDKSSNAQSVCEYVLATPEMYQLVMTMVMESAYKSMYKLLDLDPNKRPDHKVLEKLEKHPRWKKMQMQVLGFYKSILHVLASLADSNLNAEISIFLLSHLEPYIPLLAPLPRLVKGVLRVLLSIWSRDITGEEDVLNARAYVFLRIRQIALQLPGTAMDETMRSIYLSYARNCRNYTEMNAKTVMFMIECTIQIYKLDSSMAYQHAFLFVRQLALHLRTAIIKKSTEKTKELVSWQFINCLRLWTHVMCAMQDHSELGQLIYPLVQVISGVLLAAKSAIGVPLRYHLVEFLQLLAAYSQHFIPNFRTLLEVLEMPELIAKPTPSTDLAPNFTFLARLPKGSLMKQKIRDAVIEKLCILLRREAEIYRYHVGLPEYLFLTIRTLKAFGKKCKNGHWRDQLRTVVGLFEKYSSFVKTNRVNHNINPMDVTSFEPLLPIGEPCSAIRLVKLIGGTTATSITGDNLKTATPYPKGHMVSKQKRSIPGDEGTDEDTEKSSDDDSNNGSEHGDSSVMDEEDENNDEGEDNDFEYMDESENDDEIPDRVGALDWSDEEND